MSQAQLATKMSTRQPAVARLESGTSNPRFSTVIDLAEALGASVRLELVPLELLAQRPRTVPWWEPSASAPQFVQSGTFVLSVMIQHSTVNVFPDLSRPAVTAASVIEEDAVVIQSDELAPSALALQSGV